MPARHPTSARMTIAGSSKGSAAEAAIIGLRSCLTMAEATGSSAPDSPTALDPTIRPSTRRTYAAGDVEPRPDPPQTHMDARRLRWSDEYGLHRRDHRVDAGGPRHHRLGVDGGCAVGDGSHLDRNRHVDPGPRRGPAGSSTFTDHRHPLRHAWGRDRRMVGLHRDVRGAARGNGGSRVRECRIPSVPLHRRRAGRARQARRRAQPRRLGRNDRSSRRTKTARPRRTVGGAARRHRVRRSVSCDRRVHGSGSHDPLDLARPGSIDSGDRGRLDTEPDG